jgi:glycosyltransferase involved in cell wall biosynthesis
MLTVLYATRNRAPLLPSVLETYCKIIAPPGGWKLVVVDNGSKDRTEEILRSFEGRLPLTRVHEPQAGKNRALNTGLALIEGDLVVFTDDDVFPNINWLAELRASADSNLSAAIFSGMILPRWEVPPAEWVLQLAPWGVTFALTDPHRPEGPTTPDRIFGPNMAIRNDVFRKGHRFDQSIGPRDTSYAMGSESQLVRQLMQEGYAAWHCPRAIVEHFIRAAQLKKAWILDRAVRFGRGQYRLNCATAPQVVKWLGVPRYLYRRILEQGIRVVAASATFQEEKIFSSRWELNRLLGEYIEAKNIQLEASDKSEQS